MKSDGTRMTVKDISIDTIGLSTRARNALHQAQVHTVGEMMEYTEGPLSQMANLGQKSVREILAKIEEYRTLEGSPESEQAQPEMTEDFEVWMQGPSGREQILSWLQETEVRVEALELLSAREFNLLLLSGNPFLHQIAFRAEQELMEIPRMDLDSARNIVRHSAQYIRDHRDDIARFLQERTKASQPPITMTDMLRMPEYRDRIGTFVLHNDIEIDNLSLSNRPKNQLLRNGYRNLSDILFLTAEELQRLPSMGAASISQIQERIQDYLTENEARILAFCNGDDSVLLDDAAIRKAVLKLYQPEPFSGFSLAEMTERLELPGQLSQERLKKILGGLLAQKELEYVDFRCYRVYDRFEDFLDACPGIEERAHRILQLRLQGVTLEGIGQEYGLTRERVRQVIKKEIGTVRAQYAMQTGKKWFDEDYYRYFYETYTFDKKDGSQWLGISPSVWNYLDMVDAKQGKQDLESALEDGQHLDIGLRLKIKTFLNRNKILVDGIWVEKKRAELEMVVVRKFCQDDTSFGDFVKLYNRFLEEEEIPYNEDIYYTEAVYRTRKNRLTDARYLLWKQNETIRYYDIDSRDYTELLETLNLDAYENVEYSTVKFMKEYPEVMEKYDIRDQYELHNLLRKIIPEGSFHDFHCGRTPHIRFGTFDRDGAILDIIVDNAPISTADLCRKISQEYGFEPGLIQGTYLQPFAVYYHQGVYSIDQKVMPAENMRILQAALTEDFYYIGEIRKTYAQLVPNADLEEVNPYNLKSMGFVVLSRYVVQHYPSLEAYFEDLLTREDIVDLKPCRKRFAYVQMFSQKLMELKRNLDVIEFEPNRILNFRKLARAGITKEMIQDFCDAVYDAVPEGTYFSSRSLRQDGFASELYDLGFSDWFYANLLISDSRFSFGNMFGSLILYKGRENITIQSFLLSRVQEHGCVDVLDLMTELKERYGCEISEKSDITYRLKNTQVYHDKILDRLYVNEEAYYRDLEETGGF